MPDTPTHKATSGFQYGGADGATYGASETGEATGGTYGEQQPQRYRVVLLTSSGRRVDLVDLTDVELSLTHTGISTISATLPRVAGLADFAFADMNLYYGDRLLFQAVCEQGPGPGDPAEATLSGRGVGRLLDRGEYTFVWTGYNAHEAIAEVWREYTTFTASVFPPDTPVPLTEFETSGTLLEILQQLHEQAGMRFTIQHDEPGRLVESYVPRELTKPATWTTVESDSTFDVTGYYNRVVVLGEVDATTGTRITAVAEDATEIAAKGESFTYPVIDPTLTTANDAAERAGVVLASLVENDTLSGEIQIVPELVLPGYTYPITDWGTRDGTTATGVRDVPTLPIDGVTFSESRGDATASLSINTPLDDVEALGALAREQQRLAKLL